MIRLTTYPPFLTLERLFEIGLDHPSRLFLRRHLVNY